MENKKNKIVKKKKESSRYFTDIILIFVFILIFVLAMIIGLSEEPE